MKGIVSIYKLLDRLEEDRTIEVAFIVRNLEECLKSIYTPSRLLQIRSIAINTIDGLSVRSENIGPLLRVVERTFIQ